MRAGLWMPLLAVCAACRTAAPARGVPAPVMPAPPPEAPALVPVVAAPADSASPRDTSRVTAPDVTGEALKLFGDSAAAAAQRDSATAAAGPTWDMDVRSYETQERVQFYIGIFTGRARDTFAGWIGRGTRYEPMIRAKLRAARLPEDMAYLALIESGYNPNAYSSAAAVGMWQMMAGTARGVGLRVDWWVDERRDPVRATDGAIKFLRWLNEQFGSLYLAAAAYDGGPGRIARGLTRYADDIAGTTGEDVFFVLADKDYLRAETKDYVPKLIAAALVAKQPARYGLPIKELPPLAYDTVTVGPATPLAAVAKAVGATVADMRDLNPAVLRGMTPPRDSFALHVPAGSSAAFRDAFDSLPAGDRKAFARTVTRKNESLSALAARAGVTTRQLGWYNPGLKPRKKGTFAAENAVLVPSPAVVAAAADVPDPAIEIYGRSRGKVTTHVVRRGETLQSIAQRYGTSVATLRRLNGLRKDMLLSGQVIVVRGASGKAAAPRKRAAERAAAAPKRGKANE